MKNKYPACSKLGLSTLPHYVDNAMSSYACHHALTLRLDKDQMEDHLRALGELNTIQNGLHNDIKSTIPELWENGQTRP
jgi:hypothetical protein